MAIFSRVLRQQCKSLQDFAAFIFFYFIEDAIKYFCYCISYFILLHMKPRSKLLSKINSPQAIYQVHQYSTYSSDTLTMSASISPLQLSKYFLRSWSEYSKTSVNFFSLCTTSHNLHNRLSSTGNLAVVLHVQLIWRIY